MSDADSDGESNLLEFATGQNPSANTRAETSVKLNGAALEFRYTRSKAAESDGIQFAVEWSVSLLPNTWRTDQVTSREDPASAGSPDLENHIASVPVGTDGR